MAKDYVKIKRGMIFMYNIDESVNKNDVPKIRLRNGKEINDYLQYGYRPYLVVSNDLNNTFSGLCNVVPLTTAADSKSDIPAHVNFTYKGVTNTILCEQIQTINIAALNTYECVLSDEVMEQVDEALSIQLGVKSKKEEVVIESMSQIEEIIDQLVKRKYEEMKKATKLDVEDAVLRIGEGLTTLFNLEPEKKVEPIKEVKSATKSDKPISLVDKFYKKYPDKKPKEKVEKSNSVSSRAHQRVWTEESMKQFMEDCKKHTTTEMVKMYKFTNNQSYYAAKHYVANYLEKKKA